jgi:hypothetical protein
LTVYTTYTLLPRAYSVLYLATMGKFKGYYNKHSNESLKNDKNSLLDDTNENRIRRALIEKSLAVSVPPPAPPPKIITPPPTPKAEIVEDKPKTDEELEEFYHQQMIQHYKDSESRYWEWLETMPSTWEKRILNLNLQRQKYNQKAAWSANDMYEVERIDAELSYCHKELKQILDEVNEFWSDSDCDSDC